MAANGRDGRTGSSETLELSSLRELQDLLAAHGGEIGRSVRVTGLSDFRDASSVRDRLLHQEEKMGWTVEGMEYLGALVSVGGVPAVDSSAVPTAHPQPLVPAAPGAARLPAEEDTTAMDLARSMLRAGTGLRGELLNPSAALVDLATRVLQDEGPSDSYLDFATDDVHALGAARLATEHTAAYKLAQRMLRAGAGLRGDQLVPPAALLDLATRVLQDEGASDRFLDFPTDVPAVGTTHLTTEDTALVLDTTRFADLDEDSSDSSDE